MTEGEEEAEERDEEGSFLSGEEEPFPSCSVLYYRSPSLSAAPAPSVAPATDSYPAAAGSAQWLTGGCRWCDPRRVGGVGVSGRGAGREGNRVALLARLVGWGGWSQTRGRAASRRRSLFYLSIHSGGGRGTRARPASRPAAGGWMGTRGRPGGARRAPCRKEKEDLLCGAVRPSSPRRDARNLTNLTLFRKDFTKWTQIQNNFRFDHFSWRPAPARHTRKHDALVKGAMNRPRQPQLSTMTPQGKAPYSLPWRPGPRRHASEQRQSGIGSIHEICSTLVVCCVFFQM